MYPPDYFSGSHFHVIGNATRSSARNILTNKIVANAAAATNFRAFNSQMAFSNGRGEDGKILTRLHMTLQNVPSLHLIPEREREKKKCARDTRKFARKSGLIWTRGCKDCKTHDGRRVGVSRRVIYTEDPHLRSKRTHYGGR